MTEPHRQEGAHDTSALDAVAAALDELIHDLPTLPLSEHPARYGSVLDALQGVLDGARPS